MVESPSALPLAKPIQVIFCFNGSLTRTQKA